MKNKKIFMIVILVLFIIFIALAIKQISKKSNENAENITTSQSQTETQNTQTNVGESLEITDNYFIEQTNDVYINLNDYIGKTVKMQGLVYIYEDGNGNAYHAVVRNTPGCCGNDGLAGLDIQYDGDYPAVNTWVEVIGIVDKYQVYNSDVPVLKITSIKETDTGVTFVTN